MRFVDNNRAGRGATYSGPVAFMDNTLIGNDVANNGGFNQFCWELTTHFDPMMQKDDHDHPRWWYNRIPRTAYKLFDGTVHETRIFRGGLYSYAGLSRWKKIDPQPRPDNDPCAALPFTTVKYGWESLQWTGRKTAWGSDPICLDMFKYMDQAMQQLAWILDVGAQEGIQIQEVWNRDMFIYQSVAFRRSFVMTKDFFNPATAARYYYNPFADPEAITFPGLKEAVAGRAYALIPEGTMPEPLNFDVLDQFRESLKIRCPRSAVSSAGGDPMFALAVSHDDVERYIRGNEEERRYWIEADPNALIKHYGFAPSTFRRWVITNDGNQLRFHIVAKIEIKDDDDLAMLGDADVSKLDVPYGKYFVAVAVPPRIASPTRIGINGTPIPEDNPEYYMAELAVAPVFMNHVFTNQMVPDLRSLGSGTKFGPNAGLNGVWNWVNILDRETNPLGTKGNFYGIFEIFPKPEMSVVHSTSFLYRRCVAALPSLCPSENVKIVGTVASGENATLQADAEISRNGTATLVLDKKIEGAGIGTLLTVSLWDSSDSDSDSDADAANVIVVGTPGLTMLHVQLVSNGAGTPSGAGAKFLKGATVAPKTA